MLPYGEAERSSRRVDSKRDGAREGELLVSIDASEVRLVFVTLPSVPHSTLLM